MSTACQPNVLQIRLGAGVSWGQQWVFSTTQDGPTEDLSTYLAAEFRMGPSMDPANTALVLSMANGEIFLDASDPESGKLDTVTIFLADTGGIDLASGLYRWWLLLGETPGEANEAVLIGNASVIQEP